MKVDKTLPALTKKEVKQVEHAITKKMVLDSSLVAKLYNDLLRSQLEAEVYYSGLGPADGDFRIRAYEQMYTEEMLVEMGWR